MSSTTRVTTGLACIAMLTSILSGCGTANEDRASEATGPAADSTSSDDAALTMNPLDPKAKAALRVGDVNAVDPQFPIADTSQFTTIVVGKVVDFRDGPAMEDFPGDKEAQPWVVAKVQPTTVLRGDEKGGPIYVQLTLTDREGIERAIPTGTVTVMAVTPLNPEGDKYLVDPWAGVPDGATRYIAGAPYAAFADGEDRTWFPVLGETFNEPISALIHR